MSTIHFVGGEKGGVGKSVVSRLLSQYCLDNKLMYAGLDADQSHSTLSRFYPEYTQAIDLDHFESADRIMELAIEQDVQVVVDLPAQSERFLNRWMEENGVMLPVVSLKMNYKKPARYDDVLRVKTILKSQNSVKIEFDYEIYNEQNQLLTTGYSMLVFVDMKTGRPIVPPKYVSDKINEIL
mgnify:CR=1 FL=1